MITFSTLKFRDHTLYILLLLVFASCSAQVDQEIKTATAESSAVILNNSDAVTIATITEPTSEVYFDLIAKTSTCLGEDLWIGGKLESNDDVKLNKAGEISKMTTFKVTELTATGLNSNSSYLVPNKGALSAKYDESDVIHIQLNEGVLELQSDQSSETIEVAYQENQVSDSLNASNWTCM